MLPKLTSVEPIVTESLTKEALATPVTFIVILLGEAAVEIPVPPAISKFVPKLISCVAVVSSTIVILLFASLSFAIEPSNWAFVIVPDKELVG